MKPLLYLITLLLFTSISRSEEQFDSEHPVIAGVYELIGRQAETGTLMTGTVTITETKPNVFTVTREINGKTIIGTGKVDRATPDSIPVFRVQFSDQGKQIEGTFLWQSDLDNYGRLSGYVYPKGYHGAKPGLEALFHKNAAE